MGGDPGVRHGRLTTLDATTAIVATATVVVGAVALVYVVGWIGLLVFPSGDENDMAAGLGVVIFGLPVVILGAWFASYVAARAFARATHQTKFRATWRSFRFLAPLAIAALWAALMVAGTYLPIGVAYVVGLVAFASTFSGSYLLARRSTLRKATPDDVDVWPSLY